MQDGGMIADTPINGISKLIRTQKLWKVLHFGLSSMWYIFMCLFFIYGEIKTHYGEEGVTAFFGD